MKIKLVAINAKYIHSNPAIYSLKAYSGKYSKNVELGEYTINNEPDAILRDIYKSNPDVLMFSCYIWNIEMIEELASEFHKLRPEVPIWVGGPEVSYEVSDFLCKHMWCTGVMIGEGEETFKEVVAFYVDKINSLENIKGIAYLNDGYRFNGYRDALNMNDIPFYYKDMTEFENRIVYYESSRGCPFSCSYCLSSVDKKLRFRNVDTVKSELQFFMDNNVPLVKFVDRTFNCFHEHAMEIWKYIHEHDNGITCFHFEVSADLLNEEEIELISGMRPALIQLEVGVQSTNEATIAEIHRTMKLERVKEITKRIKNVGNIHQHLDLIAGLPYEDFESFKKSFDEIYSLRPDELQLGFLKVLKGSYMYEHRAEYGIEYHSKPPYEVLKTNWISYDDILKIKLVEEMTEVYYNSHQFDVTIRLLETLFDGPFKMMYELGCFYEKEGYLTISHTRLRRSAIILEFLNELFSKRDDFDSIRALFEEALTFDLYSRENCKTRPLWAADMSTYKDKAHKICNKGKLSHLEPFHYDFLSNEFDKSSLDKPIWVLFDYEDRNPLSKHAKAIKVEE